MPHSLKMLCLQLWVRFLDASRKLGTWAARSAFALGRKIFIHLPVEEPMFLLPVQMPPGRVERLRYLAWLSRRQTRLARRFGTFSGELLEQGRNSAARKVAWGAFRHWKSARMADRKFDVEARKGAKIAA